MKLRTKIILTIMLTSLTTIGAIAIIAPYQIKQSFIDSAKRAHYDRFTASISRFQQEEGEWGGKATALKMGKQIEVRQSRRFDVPPPPPRGLNRRLGMQPPPPPPHNDENTSLRFALADHLGFIFHPFGEYQLGEQLSTVSLVGADKLHLDGKHVGYAIETGIVGLTQHDEAYYNSLSSILKYVGFGAFSVSVFFGGLVSRTISRDLESLTGAVEKIGKGNLGQQVYIRGSNEVSVLAGSFNQMSLELKQTYQELTESRDEILEQTKRLEKMAITDALTGLNNRHYFAEYSKTIYQSEVESGNEVTLVVADLDWFKSINDGFGHLIGDLVLKEVGAIFKSLVDEGALVARFGGEEIVVMIPNLTTVEAHSTIESIRLSIEHNNWEKTAQGLNVTMSFGMADSRTCNDETELFRQADKALYEAKKQGRNRVKVA
ncbi:GGDEF domain-containing protein [Vibrio amylolyticus]|uniref:GGDEF domain-containing protein n=1 Tax=Vibrio amylolyticus TaxID=2847292 RepID=UPI00354C9767